MTAPACRGESAGGPRLIDPSGRHITYLRLSITDRCNLRCRYCMPEEGVDVLGHDQILSYEELERLTAIFVSLGIDKIRITGGEPFVRKGCLEFFQRLRQCHPHLHLHLTTNGVATYPHLKKLKKMGITGINLSLDTLDRTRFREIAKRDKLDTVLATFHEALRLGIPLKVNTVVHEDTNDEELRQIASLVKENPVALRFIELMPFSGGESTSGVAGEPLIDRLHRLFPELAEVKGKGVETARRFSLAGYRGTLGVIEGETRRFCGTCNKLRVTPNGVMKNCLYDSGVLDLRSLLREEPDNEKVAQAIREAVARKRANGYEAARECDKSRQDSMASIGG